LYYIIRYRKEASDEIYHTNFKKFLLKYGIDYDKELPFFKEQLDQPIQLDEKKIKLTKFRIVLRSSKNLTLFSNYDNAFHKNFFSYSRPVFTKGGKYAIAGYGESHNYHFVIFKKIKNNWVETKKYNSLRITIID
jgi:hypothetical protein